jgi:adenosylcobinamide kinase/adenosylcobinamide-phosphate guanylyltransferase
MSDEPRRVLVLGGMRSGKSAHAEGLLAGVEGVHYVATASGSGDDADWTARVIAHRARRPSAWRTLENPELPAILRDPPGPLLVDSVTAWLTGVLDAAAAWDHPEPVVLVAPAVDDLVAAWAAAPGLAVAVSDEVGWGVVPATRSGRVFADALGTLNQRLAATADEVWLVVAGRPLRLP